VSVLYLDNQLVHYEVFGRGQPVIFMHSWIGSWRYWVSTMEQLAVRYRTYALDFWGFGESERNYTSLTLQSYVDMVRNFMDTMGIRKANLVGHGMGGMVAIKLASEMPDRCIRLMLVSTPLQGSILSGITKGGTFSRLFGMNNPTSTWSKLVRQIPIHDPEVQQELYEDTDSLSEQVLSSVQKSIQGTDLRPLLKGLDENIPLLATYGEKDGIVPSDHAMFLNDEYGLPHQLLILRGVNHFPFLEETTTFSRLLMDFLVSQGSPIEIKEYWKRRVSQRDYL
jgi:pimeloyl-ACP methyl ester carboxylesterase